MKAKAGKKKSLWREIWKNKAVYLIMLPGIAWFVPIAYGPMSGLQLAFKTYSMKLGFGAAHGVGWKILSMCSEILLFEISGHYPLD